MIQLPLNPQFQELPKTYENFRGLAWKDRVIRPQIHSAGIPFDIYLANAKKAMRQANMDLWRTTVEHEWLAVHFVYRKRRSRNYYGNGVFSDKAWMYFLHQMIGYSNQLLTRSVFFHALSTYFNDFYPDFLTVSPFENPKYYKFPFKYVSTEHMYLVYQLPDRYDLLNIAEKKKMDYVTFYDYIANHVSVLNDLAGEKLYLLRVGFAGSSRPFSRHIIYRPYKRTTSRWRPDIPANFDETIYA